MRVSDSAINEIRPELGSPSGMSPSERKLSQNFVKRKSVGGSDYVSKSNDAEAKGLRNRSMSKIYQIFRKLDVDKTNSMSLDEFINGVESFSKEYFPAMDEPFDMGFLNAVFETCSISKVGSLNLRYSLP